MQSEGEEGQKELRFFRADVVFLLRARSERPSERGVRVCVLWADC